MSDEPTSGIRYTLRLFIAGTSPRSRRTIDNLAHICERYLPELYDLQIVDIYQQPHLAEAFQVVAAPTLVKVSPDPLRRIIGDLSDTAKVLRGLDLDVSYPR